MTQDTTQRLSAWRDEIAAELAGVKDALSPFESALGSAIAAQHKAAIAYSDTQHALRPLGGRLEGPLAVRAQAHLAEVEAAGSRSARLRADVEVAQRRVEELESALAQLDELLAPAEEAEAT